MRFNWCMCKAWLVAIVLIGSVSHEAFSQAVIANNPPVLSQSYTLNPDVTGSGPHCFKIATLPMDNNGDDDHLHIVANLNYGWGAAANASIDALFGNRGGFTYSYTARGVPVSSTATLVAYRNADTSVDIYLVFANVYATASYTVLETTEETVYPNPGDLGGATPLGTLVFDSSSPNYPPTTFSSFNGNVGIGTTSPLAFLSVGPQYTATNNATSMIVGMPSLGTSIDAMNYVAEFRSNSGNLDRLLIGEHRTAAGSSWVTGSWRIQPAVDGSFTGVNGNRGYIELSHGPQGSYAGIGLSGTGNTSPDMVVGPNGSVGIGTTNPQKKLDVNGDINVAGAIYFPDGSIQNTAWSGSLSSCTVSGGDYAESVDVSGSRSQYEPGDIMVVDQNNPDHFLKSSEPYSTSVAGVYSTKPGVIGRHQTTDAKTSTTEIPMAMVGIVPAKVSAENGPIRPGDILVTSSIPGHVMKGTDRSLFAGAIVGKALDSFDSGTGVIKILVSLQ